MDEVRRHITMRLDAEAALINKMFVEAMKEGKHGVKVVRGDKITTVTIDSDVPFGEIHSYQAGAGGVGDGVDILSNFRSKQGDTPNFVIHDEISRFTVLGSDEETIRYLKENPPHRMELEGRMYGVQPDGCPHVLYLTPKEYETYKALEVEREAKRNEVDPMDAVSQHPDDLDVYDGGMVVDGLRIPPIGVYGVRNMRWGANKGGDSGGDPEDL